MKAILFSLIFMFTGISGVNAQSKIKKLRFGIYAPNTAFSSNSERWSYIKRIATYVQGVTKIPCSGAAYAQSGAFAGSSGALDFALVDGVYMATRGGYKVLATSVYGGSSRAAWGLYSRLGNSFQALRGKTLVISRAGGNEISLVEGLLYGEVQVKKYFGNVKIVPDLASAIQTVRNGGGDAVFAPMKMAGGLSLVFPAGSVPNASFVQINRKIPADIVAKVRSAVLSIGSGGLGGMGGPARGGIMMGKPKAVFMSSFPGILGFQFKGFLKPFKGNFEKAPLLKTFIH
ncbi:MAG: hypothetical protein JXR95_05375 [Deltaproteobacteria bacterium]|nr:hypothetical protein [Deltaproteobacteria bacterium]